MTVKGTLRVLIALAIVVTLLIALAWLFQRRLVYFPDRDPVEPAMGPPGTTQLELRTSDGLRLGAWRVEPAGPDRDAAILVCPGNGGNRADRADLARVLAAEGFTVLLLDYRGYGGNPGSPTEAGLYADGEAAWRYLTATAGFGADRILLYGESLGGGVASHLAYRHDPAGVVLRSPFTSLADVGAEVYPFLPVRTMLWDRFPVAEHVRGSDRPFLVVYGASDDVVPPRLSRDVAAAADATTVAIPDAGHNDPALMAGPEVVEAVDTFAGRVVDGRR